MKGRECDGVLMLLPTSPLRDAEQIDGAVREWWRRDSGCSMISVVGTAPPKLRHETAQGWLAKTPPPGYHREVRDGHWEKVPPCHISNGAIQIASPATLKIYRTYHIPKTIPWVMDTVKGLDVDTEADLMIAHALLLSTNGVPSVASPSGSDK